MTDAWRAGRTDNRGMGALGCLPPPERHQSIAQCRGLRARNSVVLKGLADRDVVVLEEQELHPGRLGVEDTLDHGPLRSNGPELFDSHDDTCLPGRKPPSRAGLTENSGKRVRYSSCRPRANRNRGEPQDSGRCLSSGKPDRAPLRSMACFRYVTSQRVSGSSRA